MLFKSAALLAAKNSLSYATVVITKLNAAFTEALRTPATRERFALLMAEPVPTTPEQFGQLMTRERARYESVVKASGAHVD